MFRVLLLVLFTVAVCEATDCEHCTFQVDEAIACVNQLLRNIEPIQLVNLAPTDTCLVYGISKFKRTPGYDVCSKKLKNGGATHNFRVTFSNFTMVCVATLSENADEVLQAAAGTAKTLVPQDCPADKEEEAVDGFVKTGLPTLDPADLLKLTQCKSLPVKKLDLKGKKSKRASVSTATGTMHMEWLNAEVLFTSTTESGTDKVAISNVQLLQNKTNPINVWLEGTSTFKDMSKCLMASNFPTYLMIQAVHLILPCRVDAESKKQHDIVDYFKCDD